MQKREVEAIYVQVAKRGPKLNNVTAWLVWTLCGKGNLGGPLVLRGDISPLVVKRLTSAL